MVNYNFQEIKRGAYFGHVDGPIDEVFRKSGTFTFYDVKSKDCLDIRETDWRHNFSSDERIFVLAEVEIKVDITWRPEW